MMERVNSARTSLRLLALVCLFCAISCKLLAAAQPLPLAPDFTYGDLVAADPESLMLLHRLKQMTELKHRIAAQEHEITDKQINLEAMLKAKTIKQQRNQPDYRMEELESKSEPEALPVIAALDRNQQQPTSDKRKSSGHLSLCHFKICNLGRKKQSY